MKEISLTDLLEAGCHFGHKASRWNPQSKKYIYTEQGNIHIIDLAKTKEQLDLAAVKVKEIAASGGKILLIGTKRQASKTVMDAAKRGNLPYLISRWIGGFITNWEQIKRRIDHMNDLVKQEKEGEWRSLPKHEQVELNTKLDRMLRVYGGVWDLTQLPQAIYIIDVKLEKTATREASQARVFSIGISDTNADPRVVNIAIPANDDAVGSVELITNHIVDAYIEGRDKRTKKIEVDKVAAEKAAKVEAARIVADEAKKEKAEKAKNKAFLKNK